MDPATDSIIIAQMRARMDSIRTTQHRPTVALVLSGGGAKGVAHIGVKKFLDEVGLPIDMICGTSMGGLMGGLIALGYDTEFMDSLLTHQDWAVTLTDRVKPRHMPYFIKQYKAKYMLSVPFHYEKDTYMSRIKTDDRYTSGHPRNDGRLRLGDREGNGSLYGSNTLASSLPSGYVSGFNVNNFLTSLSVGYQDSISFKDLPIPFFCVASDLISCKAKNYGSGSLKTAMRSTMSIPGLFNPVRSEGMVLVDGGTRNNFPVDLAWAMGADYVVGVSLADEEPTYSQIHNLGTIISQFITMLGKDSFDKNIDDCNIFIKPDTRGYNMLSFSPDAIDTLIRRGYEAAKSKEKELRELTALAGNPGNRLSNKPARNILKEKVLVSSIEFQGVKDLDSKILAKKTRLKVGTLMGKEELEAAASIIQATGAFENVTYSLLGSDEPFHLVFNCVRGPVHQFGIGFRGDTEEWMSLAFNLGLNAHKLSGIKLDINGKLGTSQYLDLVLSYDSPYFPTINAEVKGAYSRYDIRAFVDPNDREWSYLDIGYYTLKEAIYLSNIGWKKVNFQLGLQNVFYKTGPDWLKSAQKSSDTPAYLFNSDHISAFANGSLYTLDDKYYPKRGVNFNFGYAFDFYKARVEGYIPEHIFFINLKGVIPIGEKFAIIPDLHMRNLVNNNHYDPTLDSAGPYDRVNSNFVGGNMAGKYMDQTIPFIGTNEMYLAKDHIGVFNLDLRVNPVRNLYISALGGYLEEADNLKGLFSGDFTQYWAAGLEVGYKTIIGPIKANLHYSSLLKQLEYFISLGFDF